MRPRFSLRWLLIVFALLTVIFYVGFVRPTVVAQRFIHAVNSGNYQELESLGMLKDLKSYDKDYTFETVKVSAKLKPRTWRDLYKFRRKALVHISFPQGHISRESGLVNYVTVHISDVKWGEEP